MIIYEIWKLGIMSDDPAFKFYMKYIKIIEALYDKNVPLDKQREFWQDARVNLQKQFEDFTE